MIWSSSHPSSHCLRPRSSYMAGKPFKVGRFAHTLRVRLMREHLGVDVDALYEEDIQQAQEQHDQATSPRRTEEFDSEPRAEPDNGIDIGPHKWDPNQEEVDLTAAEQQETAEGGASTIAPGGRVTRLANLGVQTVTGGRLTTFRFLSGSLIHRLVAITGAREATSFARTRALQNIGANPLVADRLAESRILGDERQTHNKAGEKERGFASSVVPTVEENVIAGQQPDTANENTDLGSSPPPSGGEEGQATTSDGKEFYGAPAGASKKDEVRHARFDRQEGDENEKGAARARSALRKHLSVKSNNKQWTVLTPAPLIDPDGFADPVCDEFFEHVWLVAAARNTEIYRKVFHAIPDDLGNSHAVGPLRTIITHYYSSNDLETVQGICGSP
jgi:phospholipase D1/2